MILMKRPPNTQLDITDMKIGDIYDGQNRSTEITTISIKAKEKYNTGGKVLQISIIIE